MESALQSMSHATRHYVKWWRRWWPCLICLAVFYALASIIFVCIAYAPLKVKASIEDARLDDFSLTTTQTGATMAPSLSYNISLALTVHSRNLASINYTRPLVAVLVFHDRRLNSTTAMDEGLKHPPRKTKLRLLHAGGVVPPSMLDNATVQDFKQQNATGLFKLELRLSGEIASTWPHMKGWTKKLGLSCPLSLQLAPLGPEVVVFRKVSCKLEEPEEIFF